jgi:hypothetical protein
MLIPRCPVKALQSTISDIENGSQVGLDSFLPRPERYLQNAMKDNL